MAVKMTHLEINGEDHIRLQYLPIDNKRLKADLMDSVMREPYILIVSLYKFSNEIYTAKYQNSKNENSDNDAIIYSFDENEQQLLIRFEGLIDQTFSICYVPKETLNILISEEENELEQRLEELKVMNIQASENKLTQAATRFID